MDKNEIVGKNYLNGKVIDFRPKAKVEEHDRCVVCKKITEHKKNTQIKFRKYYVEGAGQTCKECFSGIYG